MKERPTPYPDLISRMQRSHIALRVRMHHLRKRSPDTGSEDEEPAPKRRKVSPKTAASRAADAEFVPILPGPSKSSSTSEDKSASTSEDEDIAKILVCVSGSQVPHVGPDPNAHGTSELTKRVDTPAASAERSKITVL